MKAFNKRGSWIVTIPVILVSVAYLYFFFLPSKRKIAAVRAEIAAKQAYLSEAVTRAAEIHEVETELAAAQAYRRQCRADCPHSGDVGRLFGEINRRARQSGVDLTRFEPNPAEELASLDRIALRLGSQGSFAQVFELLRGLEELPATLWIDSFRLTARRGPAGMIGSAAATAMPSARVESELSLAIFATKDGDSD